MSKKDLTKGAVTARQNTNRTPQASSQCSNSGVVLSGESAKPKYNKPALSLRHLAELMVMCGILDVSLEDLENKLRFVNYYRLRGYTYPYQDNIKEDAPFKLGTKWQDIWNDYCLDQELRLLLFDGISRYEIAFRSVVTLALCAEFGSQWYEQRELFESEEHFRENLNELSILWNRSQEEFKSHYENNYDNSQKPPAWMLFETATMGIVSKEFSSLKCGLDAKKRVLKVFGFNRSQSGVFISWNHHLNYVRNICAHHARLFSRTFTITPTFCKNYPDVWVSKEPEKHKVYASICILVHLLSICSPEYPFKMKIRELLLRTTENQREMMGVPEDWMEQALFMEEEMLQLNVNPGIENEVER